MTLSELESTVYSLLKDNGIDIPVYMQDTRDQRYKGEYIEIIPLDFDESSFEASSVVNVNVHVPDVKGLKNKKRIDALSEKVRAVFRQSKDAFEGYYSVCGSGTFSIALTHDYKEENGTHFRNFRINVTYLNL